jgi:hypothetical protein
LNFPKVMTLPTDAPIHASQRNLVARLGDCVLGLAVKFGIHGVQKRVGHRVALLNVWAVVDVIHDRDVRGEFGHAAEMVAVPVRGDQVVDLREACGFGSVQNSASVPSGACAAVSCVDQDGLACRCDKKSSVAAFDVHHIDVERLPRLRVRYRQRDGKYKTQQKQI